MERLAVDVRQLEVGRGRARERTSASLRTECPKAVIGVVDERRADRPRDSGEIDVGDVAREGDAPILAAQTLRSNVPAGRARELGIRDARAAEDHDGNLTVRSLA